MVLHNILYIALQLSGSILDIHSEGHWFESANKFFHWYFYHFEKSWLESSKYTVGGLGYITVQQFALAFVFIINLCLEDSNQEPLKFSKI